MGWYSVHVATAMDLLKIPHVNVVQSAGALGWLKRKQKKIRGFRPVNHCQRHCGVKSRTAFPNDCVNKAFMASEAKQSNYHEKSRPECFVIPRSAGLLAMPFHFYHYLGIVLLETVPKKLVTFKRQWINLLLFDRPKTAGKEYEYSVIPAEAGILQNQ